MSQTYKYYYASGACSMSMHVALTELEIPFEGHMLNMATKEHKSPEFLAINPLGWVPTLVTPSGVVINEGAAIMAYLADAHPSNWFPAPGASDARAIALTWLSFANASMHSAYTRYFVLSGSEITGPALEAATARIAMLWQHVEKQLSQTTYICGETPTLPDLMLATMANWVNGGQTKPSVISFGPNTQRMLKAITSRPAFQKVMAEEQVTYKAA